MPYILDPASGHYYDPATSQWAPAGYDPRALAPAPVAQAAPAAAPAQVAQMPQMPVIDMAAINAAQEVAAIAAAKVKGRGSFYSFAPPKDAGKNWNSAPAGTRLEVEFYLCGPQATGKAPFVMVTSHKFKVAGKFRTVPCHGAQYCYICAAQQTLTNSGSEADLQKARSQGQMDIGFIWQGINLQLSAEDHQDRGVPRPFALRIKPNMHDDLIRLLERMPHMLDPQAGSPALLTRKKPTDDIKSILWSIQTLGPRPVPPEYWPCYANLYELERFNGHALLADQLEALEKAQFPIPSQIYEAIAAEQAKIAAEAQFQQGQAPAGTLAHHHNNMG